MNKKPRGYCAIGIYGGKNSINVGTLWRSANVLGASFIFTIGKRYKKQASDTMNTPRHVPMFEYQAFDEFYQNLPKGCRLIGVELEKGATDATIFKHPESAVYLLGAEDTGLPGHVLERCHEIIKLPGERSLNVSVAGSLVLYDRLAKRA